MKHYNTIGIDLGDKNHVACVIDHEGKEIAIKSIKNTKKSIEKFMHNFPNSVVAIEACVHSPWISRFLENLSHKVYVANPRRLRCIWDSEKKTDLRDARMLAKIARFDPELLYPIEHRSEEAQQDLQIIKARQTLVDTRASLINSVRSSVKVMGYRFNKSWSTKCFAKKAMEQLPVNMISALKPLLDTIQDLTDRITGYDKTIKNLAETKYPETKRLSQVQGVGPITSLAFILTIDDPNRFRKSRDIGAYLGLVPKRDQSGDTDKQLHISKAGDRYLRKLLVNCSQYILGQFGQESDLRHHGERLSSRGGKNARKRAVVAVARKLSVLLHSLWVSGEEYNAFYNSKAKRRLPEAC